MDGYANLGYQGFIVPGKKKLHNFLMFTFYYFFYGSLLW